MKSILSALEKLNFPKSNGATSKQLASLEKNIGFKTSKEFRSLYAWSNGSNGSDFYGYYRLLSLDEIVKHKKIMDELNFDELWQKHTWWNPNWVPFFEFNGDLICWVAKSDKHFKKGHIVEFQTHYDRRDIMYSSIKSLLYTLSKLYNDPAKINDWAEHLDSAKCHKIYKQLNPGFPIRKKALKVTTKTPTISSKLKVERIVLVKDNNKYVWQADIAGASVKTCASRGYSAQEAIKDFSTVEKAKTFLKKETEKRLKNGYKKGKSKNTIISKLFLAHAQKHLDHINK